MERVAVDRQPTVFDVKLAEAKRGAALLQVQNAELRRSLAAWQDFFLHAHRRAAAFETENGRLRQEVVHLEHERHVLLDIADALRDILKLKRRKS